MAGGMEKFPCIIHPAISRRKCNTDIKALKLSGTRLQSANDGKKPHSAHVAAGAEGGKLPPLNKLSHRPNSSGSMTHPSNMYQLRSKHHHHPAQQPLAQSCNGQNMTTQQLIDLLTNKLRGNGYFTLRNAFHAFDHEQRGHITKEALYRILCNSLNGITRQQFNEILKGLCLPSTKLTFTFHDVYSKFRILSSSFGKTIVDRLSCHVPRSIKAGYVHAMLVARAEKCIHHLSDFLPRWKGLEGQLDRIEFRNILAYLSLPMDNEEFDKLWRKYDPNGKGFVTGAELMQHMGVTISGNSSRPSTMSSTISGADDCVSFIDDIDTQEEAVIDLVMELSRKLKKKGELFLDDIKAQDSLKCGEVTSDQLLSSLRQLDFPVTPDQCRHLLVHFGFNPDSAIDYNTLIKKLSSVSEHSITNSILTAKDQRFVIPVQGKACLSTPDAEGRLICTLQHEFLNLLSKLRLHDRKGKGYISRADFVKILESVAPPTSNSAIQLLTDNLQDTDNGLIPYPSFLAMFDGPPVLKKEVPDVVTDTLKEGSAHQQHQGGGNLQIYETKKKFLEICRNNPQKIIDIFEDIDTANTGRLSKTTFQQILFRVGLDFNDRVINELWSDVLKNKDGTVDLWELIRQFGLPHSGHVTDSHMVWSRLKSHRGNEDDVTIIKNIKIMLQANCKAMAALLAQYDTSGCGLIPMDLFMNVLKQFVPDLSLPVISYLTRLHGDGKGNINYLNLLKDSQPPKINAAQMVPDTYRFGNNMRQLLACPRFQPMNIPLIQQKIATPPQYGLPGTRTSLQRKVQLRWLDLKRQLSIVDPSGSGKIHVRYFRYILNHYGISMSKEEMLHLLGPMIDMDEETIDYKAFFNILMGQST